MTRRKVPLVEGEFFHIYNRGNSKQKIFFDIHDRERFIKLLYLCNSKKVFNFRDDIVNKRIDAWDFDRGENIVAVGAWVLMPNHFHIYLVIPHSQPLEPLVQDKGDEKDFKSPISVFMEKLSRSYVQYLNIKYNRTGGLFEGKFKSVHVTTNSQAKYNFSYIHLNPLKLIDKNWKENGLKDLKKAKQFLKNYKWSSYLDYKGIVRPENRILNKEAFPSYFQNIEDFDTEINEWLRCNEQE